LQDLDTLEQMAVERVSAVLDKEVRYGTARHGTARPGPVRYGTVRYGRYGTVRYGTVRYGTSSTESGAQSMKKIKTSKFSCKYNMYFLFFFSAINFTLNCVALAPWSIVDFRLPFPLPNQIFLYYTG
jgi:hypothetical protein